MGAYNEDFIGQCGNCQEFEFKNKLEKGYCNWYKCYYFADDTCKHQKDNEKERSGCYITTIICNKLGFADDCNVMTSMRKLRDNIMQPNEKYHLLLAEYDIVGPIIANAINQDQDTERTLWENIYDHYLSQTAQYTEAGQDEKAINKYTEMVTALKNYYSIYEDVTELPKNYNISQSGHGKVKTI